MAGQQSKRQKTLYSKSQLNNWPSVASYSWWRGLGNICIRQTYKNNPYMDMYVYMQTYIYTYMQPSSVYAYVSIFAKIYIYIHICKHHAYIYIYIYIYIYSHPLRTRRMWHKDNFLVEFNWLEVRVFFFSLKGCHSKVKEPSVPFCNFKKNRWIHTLPKRYVKRNEPC